MNPGVHPILLLLRVASWQPVVLLYLPVAMGLALSGAGWLWYVLYGVGSWVARSAGCVINDMWDRRIDAGVERTQGRPLASGALGMKDAWVILLVLGAMGLGLFALVPPAGQWVVMGSVPCIVGYPLAKRWLVIPQLWLGVTFNLGFWVGFLTVEGSCSGTLWAVAWLCYGSCVAWTVGYDSLYSLADREDDARVGVWSAARYWGNQLVGWVAVCYAISGLLGLGAIMVSGLDGGFRGVALCAWALGILHGWWQSRRLHGVCRMAYSMARTSEVLGIFRSNHWMGWCMFLMVWAIGGGCA